MNSSVWEKNNYPQLVQLIAAEVLKQLGRSAIGLNGIIPTKDAGIELNGFLTTPQKPDVTRLEGVLTAKRLENCDSILVSRNTLITPAAKDYIKEKQIAVLYHEKMNDNDGLGVNQDGFWYFWSSCDRLRTIEAEYQSTDKVKMSSIKSECKNIEKVIEDYGQAILMKKARGGILLVENSAKANFLAARWNGIRSVIGSSDKNIEEGIKQFDANTLILEHGNTGEVSVQAMISRFIRNR